MGTTVVLSKAKREGTISQNLVRAIQRSEVTELWTGENVGTELETVLKKEARVREKGKLYRVDSNRAKRLKGYDCCPEKLRKAIEDGLEAGYFDRGLMNLTVLAER